MGAAWSPLGTWLDDVTPLCWCGVVGLRVGGMLGGEATQRWSRCLPGAAQQLQLQKELIRVEGAEGAWGGVGTTEVVGAGRGHLGVGHAGPRARPSPCPTAPSQPAAPRQWLLLCVACGPATGLSCWAHQDPPSHTPGLPGRSPQHVSPPQAKHYMGKLRVDGIQNGGSTSIKYLPFVYCLSMNSLDPSKSLL